MAWKFEWKMKRMNGERKIWLEGCTNINKMNLVKEKFILKDFGFIRVHHVRENNVVFIGDKGMKITIV